MSHFLHSIPWQAIAAIVAVVLTAIVAFRFGRRWRRGYREALANRREYHALKADAQLRASMHNEMRVDASPVINIGTGTGVQSELRDTGRELHGVHDSGPFCAFCGRYGCRANCRKEIAGGPAHHGLDVVHDFRSLANPRRLASHLAPGLLRSRDTDRLHEVGGEYDPSDLEDVNDDDSDN